MIKYLISYTLNNKVCSDIYTIDHNITEEDIKEFNRDMSIRKYGCVKMISFNKLNEDKIEKSNQKSLAAFFLTDLKVRESVLVYTPTEDIESYCFIKGKFIITIKDRNNCYDTKKYVCSIPGIWFDNENVMSKLPKELLKIFAHPYLFNFDNEDYEMYKD